MIDQEKFDQIEAYLNEDLPQEKMDEFRQAMKEDLILQQQVKEVENIGLSIQTAVLKDKLNEFHERLDLAELPGKPRNSKALVSRGIAAAILIAITAGIGLLLFQKDKENDRLFAQYYTADPGLPTVMATTEAYAFQKAMVDYKLGTYDKALAGWLPLLNQDPENDTLLYFTGSAYLANNNIGEAVSVFEKVVASEESHFYKEACWYLGLSYLKTGDMKSAKIWIECSEHRAAKDILREMN